jgi:alpha-galactosidase
MALSRKIVVIGAGSASFGLNSLAAFMGSPSLRGWRLALVDQNQESLASVHRLAQRLNREWDAQMTLSNHTNHTEALEDASYVILSIEVPPREALWRSDYEIPLKYGVRQPYAENGGPGGFAHAARNIGPVMAIVRDMERLCPQAWLINYTNPMTRICDAIARYSQIKVVGLCHQIMAGYAMVGLTLAEELGIHVPEEFTDTHSSPSTIPSREEAARQALEKVEIVAAGLNHFTWMLALHDKRTGENLYPLFAERWAQLPAEFEPLTHRVYEAFGLFPIPGDEHLCEYLPWLSDPITKPWEKYEVSLYDWDYWEKARDEGHADIVKMGDGEMDIKSLREAESEGALEIIEHLAGAEQMVHRALNIPNQGYISNLPPGAMVEVPGVVSGMGVQGTGVGPLPEGIAELCRRETIVSQLCVDAAVHGDRQAALQCLLLDPVISDLDVAQLVLDDYLLTYREHLPQFWK